MQDDTSMPSLKQVREGGAVQIWHAPYLHCAWLVVLVMEHLWLCMEHGADTVANEVTHDCQLVLLCNLLAHLTDLAYGYTWGTDLHNARYSSSATEMM